MQNAESDKTEQIRSHDEEVQREPYEATSDYRLLIFFGDGLSDKGLETFFNLFALEKPRPDEVLLDDGVAN